MASRRFILLAICAALLASWTVLRVQRRQAPLRPAAHRASQVGAGQGGAGKGGDGPAGEMRRYRCASGPIISVLPMAKDRIRLSFQGTTYNLNRVPSASGELFTNASMAWHQKGNEGELSIGDSDLAKDCARMQ